MSSLMSAISDDIQRYRALCEAYGEDIRFSPPTVTGAPPTWYPGVEDCYGEHAEKLLERARKEGRIAYGCFMG